MGTFRAVAIGERHHRLRQARIHAGFERQRDAIARFRWNTNTYKSNENGNSPFSFESAKVYAEAFGVRAEWLYSGDGPMTATTDSGVPLVGYVGAGSEAHFYASSDVLDIVPRPEGSTGKTVAQEIRGTSLGPLFERWLIYYDDVRSPVTADLYGRLCVVGLPDDRVLVKLIRPAATPNHFHLLSNGGEEPMLDQEVVWAARVKTMTPR